MFSVGRAKLKEWLLKHTGKLFCFVWYFDSVIEARKGRGLSLYRVHVGSVMITGV